MHIEAIVSPLKEENNIIEKPFQILGMSLNLSPKQNDFVKQNPRLGNVISYNIPRMYLQEKQL